jgi:hypothetical protein
MKKFVLLGAAAASLLSTPAMAWREAGHFVVCQIGWDHMTKRTKDNIKAILGNQSFAEQCTWPDMVRKSPDWKHTYNWHFINLNDGQKYFDPATISHEGDILQALMDAADALNTPSTPIEKKKYWLRFVGHFTGDVHQPLHVGRKTDLGGNNIKVSWFGDTHFNSVEILQAVPSGQPCTGIPNAFTHAATGECVVKNVKNDEINLHKVWDLQLIDRYKQVHNIVPASGDSEYAHIALSKKLDQGYDAATIKKWQGAFFHEWADESLKNRDKAYNTGGSALGGDYYDKNIGYVQMRLVQAGYRLAAFMNRTFDSQRFGVIKVRYFDLAYLELKERIHKLLNP